METSIVDEPPSQALAIIGQSMQVQDLEVTPLFIILIGVLLLALLAVSAIISGSEVAFFSINLHELDNLKKDNGKSARRIVTLLDRPKYLLATILILNNFVNVAIVTISTYVTWSLFKGANEATLITTLTLVVTFLIVFFGEIVPKIYATRQRLPFARRMSALLTVGAILVKPLSWALVNLTLIVEKRIEKKDYASSSIEEVHHALEITTQSGITEEDKDILKGIVNFSSISVTQVMHSRIDIIAVEKNINYHELMEVINKEGFSRIPVFDEDIDKIDGILYVKDLLPHIDEEENFKWQELLRPVYFVPESKMIDDLLKDFQEKRVHIAIVVDEYGGTAGLLTMEDILEEIVGEIKDEFDDEEKTFEKIASNIYDFEGRTSINDMSKALKVDVNMFNDIKGESETVSGMLLEQLGNIPNSGEFIDYKNYTFTILAVDKRRIKRVRVEIK